MFLGFWYRDPYVSRYGDAVRSSVSREGWEPLMPLAGEPGGLMLDRIAAMIRGSQRAVYEVGVDNGNVLFELGISLGLRQPVALTTDRDPLELHDVLRTPWLVRYADDEGCVQSVLGFLRLRDPQVMVPGALSVANLAAVAVLGEGERAAAVSDELAQQGRQVVTIAPSSIRSLSEAVEVADTFGAVVGVRPEGETWSAPGSIVTLVALGAAFALSRMTILVAADGEFVPSDCMQLLVRSSAPGELAKNVVGALERPRPAPPPSGTMRPRITGALERQQRTPIGRSLIERGAAALDAEPGYGKTTILTQVADLLAQPTAWITIEADWSITDLVERIVAAVGEHAPSFGWNALVTLREAAQRTPRASPAAFGGLHPAAIAQMIAKDVEMTSATGVLLVVDDVHKATDEGAQLLASLIGLAPPRLRMIFAGRGLPNDLGRLTAGGRVPSWGAEELRFSRDETASYLNSGGRSADDERIGLLHERTEGWQAALAVIRAWLDMHGDATIEQLRAMARGDRHQVYQVFATDYFAGLNPGVRNDLLLAALPIRLEDKVAERLYGPGGAMRLRELAAGPYFLTEDGTSTFRLHSLFREFLGQRWIEDRGRESLLEQRSALARWYRETGDAASAFQVACEAEDWETAAQAIEPAIRVLTNQGDSYFVFDVLKRLPEDRIRASRPLWESWVRAISHLGDPRALAEAKALADSPGSPSDQALADLVLAELLYERGEIGDEEMGRRCDEIADRVREENAGLAVQARLQGLGARTVHSADPDAWPRLLELAMEVGDAAIAANLPAVAAIALAQAGDMAARIFQATFITEFSELRFAASFGMGMPLAERVRRARELAAVHSASVELYTRAFQHLEDVDEPLAVAHVQLSYARTTTAQVMNEVLRSGDIADDLREIGEQAIRHALTAAEAYARRGVLRSVAISLNAAAEAASALNDRERRDQFCTQAAALADQHGYVDLVATADRIRSRPTALEFHVEITNPPPFHQETPSHLEELIDAMLDKVMLSTTERSQARAVLQRMLSYSVYLDRRREEVCQYLDLFQDFRGPKIGPFEAQPPKWRVICRMRGLITVAENRNAGALIRQFVSGFCDNCALRSPAATRRQFATEDEEIWAPMLKRIAAEQRQPQEDQPAPA